MQKIPTYCDTFSFKLFSPSLHVPTMSTRKTRWMIELLQARDARALLPQGEKKEEYKHTPTSLLSTQQHEIGYNREAMQRRAPLHARETGKGKKVRRTRYASGQYKPQPCKAAASIHKEKRKRESVQETRSKAHHAPSSSPPPIAASGSKEPRVHDRRLPRECKCIVAAPLQ